ncbi:class I tRNA ligase family protein [Staphylococcus aureus]
MMVLIFIRNVSNIHLTNGWKILETWTISRQLWWGHQIPAWYGKKK